MSMLNPRVANDQSNVVRDRQIICPQRTAVEHQCMLSTAVHGNELVHDADARSNKFVLASTASDGELQQINGCIAAVEQGIACSYFNCRRGAEPCFERYIAADNEIRAAYLVATELQCDRGAGHVVTPIPTRSEIRFQIDCDALVVVN